MFSWAKVKFFQLFFYIVGSAIKKLLDKIIIIFFNLGSIFGGLEIDFFMASCFGF
jgi:predicted membrane chloride channel (bestrophin family)